MADKNTKVSIRVNGQITARQVRLIGSEGEQLGLVNTREALKLAEQQRLDLVEISPTAEPPVCRITDFGKFIYERNKKQAAARKKAKQVSLKEVKFRPSTEEGDYQTKLRNLIRFLSAGDKVKVSVRFRGREIAYQELGMQLLERIQKDLAEYGQVEQRAKLEGRQLTLVIAPKRKG